MRLRHLRHATVLVTVADRGLLVDPMLGPAGGDLLCELPEPPAVAVTGVTAALVTRADHVDDAAAALLHVPVLCHPEDAEALRAHGFGDVRPLAHEADWEGVPVTPTPSGFVLAAPGEPVLYVAGDAPWGDEVQTALERHRPDTVIVNAGAAPEGTMTADDVIAVARHAPAARVVAVHLEAFAHAGETRADVHQRVHEHGLEEHVTIPEDGAEVPLASPR